MIQNKKIKKILVGFMLILAATGAGAWFYYRHSQNRVEGWQDGINYSPPTEQEKSSGDNKKQDIVTEQEKDQQAETIHQDQTQTKSVSVVITDAAQYGGVIEVRSFVPSYSQDGTCNLVFTQGVRSFARTTPGYKDVSSTVCPAVEIKKSEFPSSGEWQVVVKFESSDAKGQSEPRMFTVE